VAIFGGFAAFLVGATIWRYVTDNQLLHEGWGAPFDLLIAGMCLLVAAYFAHGAIELLRELSKVLRAHLPPRVGLRHFSKAVGEIFPPL